jgi:hypothetical protein
MIDQMVVVVPNGLSRINNINIIIIHDETTVSCVSSIIIFVICPQSRDRSRCDITCDVGGGVIIMKTSVRFPNAGVTVESESTKIIIIVSYENSVFENSPNKTKHVGIDIHPHLSFRVYRIINHQLLL